jgi:hypothetical protein
MSHPPFFVEEAVIETATEIDLPQGGVVHGVDDGVAEAVEGLAAVARGGDVRVGVGVEALLALAGGAAVACVRTRVWVRMKLMAWTNDSDDGCFLLS